MATEAPERKPTAKQLANRFDAEKARAAGRKSAASRRARAAARAALPTELRQHLAEVRTSFTDVPLHDSVVAVAGIVLARVAKGEIPVRNAGEAADLLRALHEIARLESGQPTAIKADLRVDGNAALERLELLRASANATLGAIEPSTSATVPAADDGQVSEPPSDVVDGDVVEAEADLPPVVEGDGAATLPPGTETATEG